MLERFKNQLIQNLQNIYGGALAQEGTITEDIVDG
jgi:hypothetical protein